jgi:hypothetical protein
VGAEERSSRSEKPACGPTYVLPSENEWYKAAYHQPAEPGGDTDDYWLYPTRSNVLLPSEPPIASFYGTFGQSDGAEWLDALITFEGGSTARLFRSFESDRRNTMGPTLEAGALSFRVATRNTGSADFDLDLDVDLRDYAHFQNQLGGPK